MSGDRAQRIYERIEELLSNRTKLQAIATAIAEELDRIDPPEETENSNTDERGTKALGV
jgi:hypothetical protein